MGRRPQAFKDQELLNILQQNARTSLSDIAKQLKVSRATVQSRVSRLERDGYISGYTIITGAESTGIEFIHSIVMVDLEVRNQSGLVSELRKMPEIVSCYTTSGQHDIFLKLQCRTPSELDEAIDRIAQLEGVRKTTSSILLSKKFVR